MLVARRVLAAKNCSFRRMIRAKTKTSLLPDTDDSTCGCIGRPEASSSVPTLPLNTCDPTEELHKNASECKVELSWDASSSPEMRVDDFVSSAHWHLPDLGDFDSDPMSIVNCPGDLDAELSDVCSS